MVGIQFTIGDTTTQPTPPQTATTPASNQDRTQHTAAANWNAVLAVCVVGFVVWLLAKRG